jgi:aminopeptidase N
MSDHVQTIAAIVILSVLLAACGGAQPTETPVPATDTPVPVVDTPVPATDTPVPAADTPAPGSDLTSTEAPTPEPPWDDRTVFQNGLIEAERGVLDGIPGASVYHIDLVISEDLLLLEGQQTVHYTNQEDKPLDEIYFRLFPNTAGGRITISSAKVDEADVETLYEFEDSALRVPLPGPLPPGDQLDLQLDFQVEVAQEMAGNYGLFGYFDGVLVLDEFYPVIPVYDDEGWNVEVPPPNGDVTYYDASFYLVRVTAPVDLTIVASGIETGREDSGESQTVSFAAGPARDFYLAASERFTVVSGVAGETKVNSYAFPEWIEGAKLALQLVTASLTSFSERLGTYPYTEFDVVSTPMMALGMEYPAMTAITLREYDPDETISGLPSQIMLESTVAHEVAHQWFYNVVGNDQVDEPWMDEALVQYLTGRYYVDTYGEEAFQSYRDSWVYRWQRVEQAEIPIGLPSAAYAENAYGAIVYGRGPIFVEALAKEMGQDKFDAFMRDYYQSHKWGIGTGEAFRELAEAHCQCDLTTLFEEWVYER